MKKTTKNIITRDWIDGELHFYNKADIRSTLVSCIISSLFFVPFAILSAVQAFEMPKDMWMKVLFSILTVGIMLNRNLPFGRK